MGSLPGVVSPEAPPTQNTADQDTAPTPNPSPPRTHTQAASTPDSATAAQDTSTRDFATEVAAAQPSSIRQIPTPTTLLQTPPPQSPTSQSTILTPAHYIPPRPSSTIHLSSSARPSTTTQPNSAQAQPSTDEITPIPQIGESSTQSQPPRRYTLPPRPASFKGCDQCWEMLHDPTVPVLYIPPVDDREGWRSRIGGWLGDCWPCVKIVFNGIWEWVKRYFCFL